MMVRLSSLCILLTILALSVSAADPAPRKILVLGNSITRHGPAPHIGWEGDWGMAASAKEKDFVHVLAAKFEREAGARPEMLARNIADFERKHATYEIEKELAKELAFRPQVVIVAIGENVPDLSTDEAKKNYAAAYFKLLALLKENSSPAIFARSCFWPNAVKDEIMKQASTDAGVTFVDISALGKDPANAARAERKIEHDGVAGHPGDKGMQAIADALFTAIQKSSK